MTSQALEKMRGRWMYKHMVMQITHTICIANVLQSVAQNSALLYHYEKRGELYG